MKNSGDKCVSSDCLAVQTPKDVRYISRLKIYKEGCQGDVNMLQPTRH